MATEVSIVWFRQDLRVADNPALAAAVTRGSVAPVYIWAPEEEGAWTPGGATRWWLHQSLESLGAELAELGAPLLLRQGDSLGVLRQLVAQSGATAVYWNRRYEPAAIERDQRVKGALRKASVEAKSFNGSLLHEPWEIETNNGNPYKVFTPFWKTCRSKKLNHKPRRAPGRIKPAGGKLPSEALDDFSLLPTLGWDEQFWTTWDVGAAAAKRALANFVKRRLGDYAEDRNRCDIEGWSQLSPHLHFGELSPRQVWQAVQRAVDRNPKWRESGDIYLAEIGWREFAHHLLYHFPKTVQRPLRTQFEDFPWAANRDHLRAWQRGKTGYPVVDAAMRQLWAVGWMPNRARMIVASFLAKHLLLPWQEGAAWFWDTLVDADLANNTLGWQWTAGCGADAAPYFRIFNPTSQAEKFDPHGDYIRRWVPELSELERPWIFRPWEADHDVLAKAGVALGVDYPAPIVDHSEARMAALAAYEEIRG